jgi:hypothetical protein
VLVSYYNFLKSHKVNEIVGTIEDLADDFCDGKVLYGPYWDHLNQYDGLENVHFVHYEDLIEVNRIKTI